MPISLVTLRRPADLLAFQVDNHHVGGLHGALADAGRSDKDAVLLKPYGEIAVHGGDVPLFVEHASVADDFFPMFAFRRHGYPWGERLKSRPQLTFA